MMLRSVLLPEPLGPMRASNEPSGTSRLRLLRTSTGSLPRKNTLLTPRSSMIGVVPARLDGEPARCGCPSVLLGDASSPALATSTSAIFALLLLDFLAVLQIGRRVRYHLRAR